MNSDEVDETGQDVKLTTEDEETVTQQQQQQLESTCLSAVLLLASLVATCYCYTPSLQGAVLRNGVVNQVSFRSFWKWVVLPQALKKMGNATPYSNKNG